MASPSSFDDTANYAISLSGCSLVPRIRWFLPSSYFFFSSFLPFPLPHPTLLVFLFLICERMKSHLLLFWIDRRSIHDSSGTKGNEVKFVLFLLFSFDRLHLFSIVFILFFSFLHFLLSPQRRKIFIFESYSIFRLPVSYFFFFFFCNDDDTLLTSNRSPHGTFIF